MRQRVLELAIALAVCAIAPIAQAQVYKCTDAAGRTTYSDTPCDSRSKPLSLPDPAKRSATDPNMCAQLLDELNRLAAAADRNTQRARKESASSANRRKSLTRQYEARCVGIARSDPRPK
jgi:flagellar motility protein MotE (MotC chaperone)